MGTVYRTSCGCIASSPEPEMAEYETYYEYNCAHSTWVREWEAIAFCHEESCETSAHYQGYPATKDMLAKARSRTKGGA